MQQFILVSQESPGRYTARSLAVPEVKAEAESEGRAIEQVRASLIQWFSKCKVVSVQVPNSPTGNPWLDFAGSSKDDPQFDEYLDAPDGRRLVCSMTAPSTQSGATIRLNLLVLRTTRLDELVAFYSALGVIFTRERHGGGPEHYAGDLSGVVFEIYPARDGTTPDAETRLGFHVDHLYDTLARLGVTTEPRLTEWGLHIVVRDPDGRAVELYG